jgi:hypothetical protein
MDKAARNAIERATQQARKLLDEDFSSQLEGTFDVLRSGIIASKGGVHLSDRQDFQRDKIVAAIEHKRAAGTTAVEAVTDYVRDAAFTTLNRFVALKLLEARQLVQECITKGEQSGGYREFCGMAPGVALLPDAMGYRLYVESLFDEFSTEIKVLFDRHDAASILWPKRQTFEALLTILNAPDLSGVWGEDETIGWVYQFFNSGEERRKMRDESPAPRNSRELAVRNQFFTPRYVVQFLVDNTLGRLWLEMHGEQTGLGKLCEYLVRATDGPSQPRPRKDPRDLRILDPACGSGHFLLYSFDLLLVIYEETWAAEGVGVKSETSDRSLRDDYPDFADLRLAAPRLIVENNLYGVDIDPRCAQIAALALWLRAQRAWKELGVAASDRPRIQRTHIVVAEPMPGEASLVDDFAARLDPPLLRDLFKKMVAESHLAGELGTLLRAENGIAAELRRAREQFVKQRDDTGFLPGIEPVATQGHLDLSGIDDDDFFHVAETQIVEALRVFVESATGSATVRRLFAGDSAQGIAFIDILKTRFDVVLMNPPFGEASKSTEKLLSPLYPTWNSNILCAFIARSSELIANRGLIGSVVDRTIVNKSTYEEFRRAHLLAQPVLLLAADLGWEVLDANVEVAALVLGTAEYCPQTTAFFDVRDAGSEKPDALKFAANNSRDPRSWKHTRGLFSGFPSHALVYDLPDSLLAAFTNTPSLAGRGLRGYTGHQLQSSRHFFLSWELPAAKRVEALGPLENFCRLYNGGEYSRFLLQHCEIARFGFYGSLRPEDVTDYTFVLRNKPEHFKPGVAFGVRGDYLDAHLLSSDFLFTVEGQLIPIEDEEMRYFVLGYLNSTVASRLLNCFCGQHKYSGYVNQIPCPDPSLAEAKTISLLAREACRIKEKWFSTNETCDWFQQSDLLRHDVSSFAELVSVVREAGDRDTVRLREIVQEIDILVLELLDAADDYAIADIERYRQRMPLEMIGAVSSQSVDELSAKLARDILSFALGCCFGRWQTSSIPASTELEAAIALGAGGVPLCARALSGGALGGRFLVDDPGVATDLIEELDRVLAELASNDSDAFKSELLSALGHADLREYVRASRGLFDDHLKRYADGRRTAPIYWQIGIPSGRYSVWLYAHGLTRDSLFRLQNDVVTPKLAHEERQLANLIEQGGSSPPAKVRKEIAGQETFVEEVRTLLSELKRVAPLWNPALDDGLTLTMAPLWRLVPQHKAWQKELKTNWDDLLDGKYDWAHIAMHLCPERVVSKCATDRSLAIVHGLEDVLWTEVDDGKWKPRRTLAHPLKEIVRARTTTAIEAVLQGLVESSTPKGSKTRTRRSTS